MTIKKLDILLLEDDVDYGIVFQRIFNKKGHSVDIATKLDQFDRYLQENKDYQLILMDLKLDHETSLYHIRQARSAYPLAKIYMITGFASIATTVEAIKQGADDYLPKPVSADDILSLYTGATPVLKNKDKPLSPKRLEWEHIQRVLKDNEGNISRTAEQLNMHRRTLQRKLKKKPSPE